MDTNKAKYIIWSEKNYVPIYSKPWWLDAICGEDNWNVWLYVKGSELLAAMPYYKENRNGYIYITKPPLTQNNGIIFKEDMSRKAVSKAEFEEKVINEACKFIANEKVDVYEQQYQPSFDNWLPFYWNNYKCYVRYTYVINNTNDIESIWNNVSSKYRNKIKNGIRNISIIENPASDIFYKAHERVFLRQGKKCPFSIELWDRLYNAVIYNKSGCSFFAEDEKGNVSAVLFLVWDERRVYQILGGYMEEYTSSQAYPALIYHGIKIANKEKKVYDFEGSMIKPISIAFRQFGGDVVPYYRIRKIFNPDIIIKEAEEEIMDLAEEGYNG